MSKFFLDTNIIIYFIKGQSAEVLKKFENTPRHLIQIPSIVRAEIEYGVQKSNDYENIVSKYHKIMDCFETVFFDNEASKCYGYIRWELEKIGKPIGPNDLMIAAIAMSRNGVLITNNEKEFSRIKGLKIENWTKGEL